MRIFYALLAGMFGFAEYQVVTDAISQLFVSAALGAGIGYFTSKLVYGD